LIIQSIELKNFRNWELSSVQFSPLGNIFFGKNGQGKTNLLEAISYFQMGKSFRGHSDKQLIRFNEQFFYLKIGLQEEYGLGQKIISQETVLKVDYQHKKTKNIFKNNQKINRLSELIGVLHFVILSLEDRKITQGHPGYRRKFLDIAISQIDPVYLDYLQQMKKLLKEKSFLIKETQTNSELIALFNQQLAYVFAQIMEKRRKFIEQLNPIFKEIYHYFNSESEIVHLAYQPNLKDISPEQILSELNQVKEQEIFQKSLIRGAHRDDFKIFINKKESRYFASQGQHKSLIIALKISLSNYYQAYFDKKPILILDDIFSELDNERSKSLISLFELFTQVFLSLPRKDELELLPKDYKIFEIDQGTTI